MDAVENLAFYYSWEMVPDGMLSNIMSEFSWHGVKHLVFSGVWLRRLLSDPGFFPVLKRLVHENRLDFTAAHGLYGQPFDLSCREQGRREGMIADHRRAMGYCADLGCTTYTVHIGAYDSVFFGISNEELRRFSLDTLEKLLPEAEKLGLIIAVENSYERSNTPDEVLYCIRHFNSEYIQCCYDTGHAHIMEPAPGKVRNAELQRAWGGNGVDYPDAVGKLAPHIVTCHMHDNDGCGDDHQLPGLGNIDWEGLLPVLVQCPRMRSMQTEVRTDTGLSVGRLVETFEKLMAPVRYPQGTDD